MWGVVMLKRSFLAALFLVLLFCSAAYAAVNINDADENELSSLNGIGPVKASAIIDYRNEHGEFKSIEELKEVKGIGPKTVEKLRRQITVAE